MMIRSLPLAAFFISPSLLACIELPVVRLSDTNYRMLVEQLDADFPDIDAKNAIRRVESYGLTAAYYAQVEFEPHRQASGAEHYYSLGCTFSEQGEWNCSDREERREVSLVGPEDKVRIADDIDARSAIRIAESIRAELFISKNGFYTYNKYGKTEASTEPLNLTYIYRNHEGKYVANAAAKGACKVHSIVVREIACGLNECAFEVVQNVVLHAA